MFSAIRNTALVLAVALSARPAEACPFAYMVGNNGTDSVVVIDTATNKVVGTVPVSMPTGVAITPDGKQAYVTSERGEKVSVIDTATNNLVTTFFALLTRAIAIAPDGRRAYLANPNETAPPATVRVIDITKNPPIEVAHVTLVAEGAADIAVTPDGSRVYVTNNIGNAISVIETATNTLRDTVQVGNLTSPTSVAITPDGQRAYVTSGPKGVVVLDTASNTIEAQIQLPAGSGSQAIAVTPDGQHVYVLNFPSTDNGNVSVIETATNTLRDTVQVGGQVAHGLAITPDGQHAYVTSGDNVVVIDTATKNVVKLGVLGVGGPVAITPLASCR
jgi:YVTN family beta-propeller protein